MNADLAIGLFVGLMFLIVVLYAALRRWTASKQQQLSAEEFRRWFAKTYMGMQTESVGHASPEARPARPGKASARSG